MRDEAALRAMFEAFDPDGNGTLAETQFKNLVRKLGLKVTDTKASKAFLTLDAQGTGRVDFNDFKVWWFKYDRP